MAAASTAHAESSASKGKPLVHHYLRPAFYEKQLDAIFNSKRYSVIESSTKAGKTIACIVWLFEKAMQGTPGHNYWWIAPVTAQAKIAFRRLKRFLPEELYNAHETELTITLANGAVIWFKGSDKPDCYDDKTEILTHSGWKLFAALGANDRVLTRSPDGEAQWQVPTRIVACPYAGEMVTIQSGRIDACVTPNHRMLIERQKGAVAQGKWDRKAERTGKTKRRVLTWDTADNLRERDTIPAKASWVGEDVPLFSEDDCALLGFYLAEGSAIGNCSQDPTRLTKRNGYRITFAQTPGLKGGNKGNVRDRFAQVLRRLGHKYSERKDALLIWDKALWHALINLGNKYTKFIPPFAKNLPPSKLLVLLEWMILGDGTSCRKENGTQDQWTYFTVSKRLADDVQEISIKCGWSASIKERASKPYGRDGAKASGATGYMVSIQKAARSHHLVGRKSYIGRTAYAGMVYCVSVPNRSVLVRRNGKPLWCGNSLYGEDVYAAVIDEASRCRQDSFIAVRTTLTATGGPIRIIGNVKGRKNWAYHLARVAESGDPNMHYAHMSAYDAADGLAKLKAEGRIAQSVKIITREEIEDAKRMLPESAFNELYLGLASDDGSNPFGLKYIRARIAPLSSLSPQAWGWDLAKHVDWTVGTGLDQNGYTAQWDRFQAPWEATTPRIIAATGYTPALVDSTGVGDPILERLQKDGGPNFEGYTFTSASKQRLMEGLAAGIQHGEVHYPDGQIVTELEEFEYEYYRGGIRYSAPEGMNDDSVCSLALAYQQLRSGPTPMKINPKALARA